jgi:cyclohexa-1,5-dienecarbonyl-CoA hydratase
VTATRPSVAVELLEDGTLLRLRLAGGRGNVLTIELLSELEDRLAEARVQPRLRLVLLCGEGGHFSYGASIAEHRQTLAPALLATFHRVVRSVYALPVPIAALVEGQCLGAGFELALACHLLFAGPEARFGCPEVKLGVFPPVLAALGAARLGGPLADRLMLTGEVFAAAQAEAWGLLAAPPVPGGAGAEEAVLAWYRERLRPLSAFALRQGTQALRRHSGELRRFDEALAAAEAHYLGEVLDSHDGNEGIEAFLERRPPVWRDR